jgi:hypothetical protein
VTVAIIIAAIVAVAVAVYFLTLASRGGRSVTPDFTKPPAVADFHVRDDTALVLFDVKVAGELDEHFASVLTAQALEIVREKQHHLPIAQVTKVVAQGRRNGESVEVGRVKLETPGELPPPLAVEAPHARTVANDPLAAYSETLSGPAPTTAGVSRVSELGPAGSDLVLPTSVVLSLSERGFDVLSMTAGDLALELLEMAGYTITPDRKPDCYSAVRGGSRTYLCNVGLGDYPEIESRHINAFVVDFLASKADRGLLISDRYGPFEVYDREKREPRVRFVTRERLQSFVDALTIS